MAAASSMDELEALEQARARLEAALAEDENWRALRRPVPHDPRPSAAMARLARNNRLEMALAGNELYRAWKHVNVAIEALRARHSEGAASARDEGGASAAPAAPGAAAALRTARGLMRRLEAVQAEPPREAPPAEPASEPLPARPGADRPLPRRRPERKVRPAVTEPAEATVTFVVREQAITTPAESRPEGNDAQPAQAAAAPSAGASPAPPPLAPFTEEAEVTIVARPAHGEPQEGDAEPGSLANRRRRTPPGEP